MSDPVTDQVLVARVQQGDKHAFNLLVMRYQQKIASLLSRYLNNYDDVVEVTQEVFIKAYRALANFRGESEFYSWLYRIAVNSAKTHLLRQKKQPYHIDIEEELAVGAQSSVVMTYADNPESELLSDELRKIIFQTLGNLPEEYRVAIELRELEGLSYDEIAAEMGCPVGTVRSRIFRARDILSRAIRAPTSGVNPHNS